MEINSFAWKATFAVIATAFTFFFGGFDKVLQALIIFIVIDYVTGIANAILKKEVSSYKGLEGIARKVFLLILVGIANVIDNLTGQPYLRTAVCYMLISNEGISILENMGKIGVPIPEGLKNVIAALKENKQ